MLLRSLAVFIMVLTAVVILAAYNWGWQWTGFVSSGSNANSPAGTYKTLWDWLDLLIVPVALAIAGYVFTRWDKAKEQALASERHSLEVSQALEQQREARLQLFLERMSKLLIEQNLRTCEPESPTRAVAQASTLATLRGLDADRKITLLNFLREAQLIDASQSIIKLRMTDYSFIDMHRAALSGTDLRGIDFHGSKLRRADFHRARLFNANFAAADVTGGQFFQCSVDGAQFVEATLSEADFAESSAIGADFSHATMHECNFANAHLIGGKFISASLIGSSFAGADLSGADFSGADLSSANFAGSYLFGANFTDTRLSATAFDGAVQIGVTGL